MNDFAMLERLAAARDRLRATGAGSPPPAAPARRPFHTTTLPGPIDVMVTPGELNDQHGTGFLVKRVFRGWRSFLSLRVRDDYGGAHDFGDEALLLPLKDAPRREIYRAAVAAVGDRQVRRVFAVPYTAADLTLAMAVSDVAAAPLCVWIMDDQCVAGVQIPRPLMAEVLGRCALRLTTHTELRDAYEQAFGLPFACLPAVVPGRLVRGAPTPAPVADARGALLGSVWSRRWLERLLSTLDAARLELDWYGNHGAPWLRIGEEELRSGGLHPRGVVAEPELAERLRGHPFIVVPTGTLAGDDPEYDALAALSLPGRILFAAATAHVPVLIVGSDQTPASAFVARHGLGLTAPYDGAAFRAAARELARPERQVAIRRAAAALAPSLSDDGVGEWLAASISVRRPVDDRFERLFPRSTAREEAS